jgi:hypothetical protein
MHPRPENAPVFKGVSWSPKAGSWRTQAWDGKRVSSALCKRLNRASQLYDIPLVVLSMFLGRSGVILVSCDAPAACKGARFFTCNSTCAPFQATCKLF